MVNTKEPSQEEKKRLREEQDPLIQNLLDQVVAGLKKQGFAFTFEKGFHGDQTYTYNDPDLDLEIKIKASISWEYVEVLPCFHIDVDLAKYCFLSLNGGPRILGKIEETSGLGQVCPYYANSLEPNSAEAVVACIVLIKQRWAEFQPRVLELAERHHDEVDQLTEEAALPPLGNRAG